MAVVPAIRFMALAHGPFGGIRVNMLAARTSTWPSPLLYCFSIDADLVTVPAKILREWADAASLSRMPHSAMMRQARASSIARSVSNSRGSDKTSSMP